MAAPGCDIIPVRRLLPDSRLCLDCHLYHRAEAVNHRLYRVCHLDRCRRRDSRRRLGTCRGGKAWNAVPPIVFNDISVRGWISAEQCFRGFHVLTR